MITLFIIICFVIAIYCALQPDKRNEEQQQQVKDSIKQLPVIDLHARPTTTFQNILNLSTKSSKIETFYHEKGWIRIKMQDGKFFKSHLNNIKTQFHEIKGITQMTVSSGKRSITIVKYEYIFTEDEWDIIIKTLMLSGVTFGSHIFWKTYKNVSLLSSIIQGLSKI